MCKAHFASITHISHVFLTITMFLTKSKISQNICPGSLLNCWGLTKCPVCPRVQCLFISGSHTSGNRQHQQCCMHLLMSELLASGYGQRTGGQCELQREAPSARHCVSILLGLELLVQGEENHEIQYFKQKCNRRFQETNQFFKKKLTFLVPGTQNCSECTPWTPMNFKLSYFPLWSTLPVPSIQPSSPHWVLQCSAQNLGRTC